MADMETLVGELLDKLTDERFLDFVDNFTDEHCHAFEEGEQKLEYTTIHNQYKRLFESRMESHLKKAGVSLEAFAQLLQEKAKDDASYAHFFDMLLVTEDYSEFCAMMLQKKQEEQEEDETDEEDEAAKAGGDQAMDDEH